MKLLKSISPLMNKDSGALTASEPGEAGNQGKPVKTLKITKLLHNHNNANQDKLAIQTFKAKFFGSTFISESRGDLVCEKALGLLKAQLLASKAHKKRIQIRVDVDEIYVLGARSLTKCHVHRLENITYIWTDACNVNDCGIIVKQPLLGDNVHEFYGYKLHQNITKLIGTLKQRYLNLDLPDLPNDTEQDEDVSQCDHKSVKKVELKESFDLIRLDDSNEPEPNTLSSSSSNHSGNSNNNNNNGNRNNKNRAACSVHDNLTTNKWTLFDENLNMDPWSQRTILKSISTNQTQPTMPSIASTHKNFSSVTTTVNDAYMPNWSSYSNVTYDWPSINQNNTHWNIQNSMSYVATSQDTGGNFHNSLFPNQQAFITSITERNIKNTGISNDDSNFAITSSYAFSNYHNHMMNTGMKEIKNPFLTSDNNNNNIAMSSIPNETATTRIVNQQQDKLFDNLFTVNDFGQLTAT